MPSYEISLLHSESNKPNDNLIEKTHSLTSWDHLDDGTSEHSSYEEIEEGTKVSSSQPNDDSWDDVQPIEVILANEIIGEPHPADHQFYDLQNEVLAPTSEKKRVLTVCFCGTGSNQDDITNYNQYFNGENINKLYSVISGKEYFNKLIIDGPGSGEKNINSYWVPYPAPYSDWNGKLCGAGIDERIAHAIAVIKNEPQRPVSALPEKLQQIYKELIHYRPITHLVCAGWSRGADALIRLANRLYEDPETKLIKITLVLLDPVPGFARADSYDSTLSPNVEYCYLFYAKDECSIGFNTIISSYDPKRTDFYCFAMPGSHSHLAGSDNDHGGMTSETADLKDVAHVTQFFLQMLVSYHGTLFDITHENIFKLTLSEIAHLFQKIKKNESEYKHIAQKVSYTHPQLIGEEKKIILGYHYWGNQYLSFLPKELQNDLDQLLFSVSCAAEKAVEYFVDQYDQILAELSDDRMIDVEPLKRAFWKVINGNITKEAKDNLSERELYRSLFFRVISEGLQAKYKHEDLNHINKRCYRPKELEHYLCELLSGIEAHNRSVQLLSDLKQFKQIKELYDHLNRIFMNVYNELNRLTAELNSLDTEASNFKVKINQYKKRYLYLYSLVDKLSEINADISFLVSAIKNDQDGLAYPLSNGCSKNKVQTFYSPLEDLVKRINLKINLVYQKTGCFVDSYYGWIQFYQDHIKNFKVEDFQAIDFKLSLSLLLDQNILLPLNLEILGDRRKAIQILKNAMFRMNEQISNKIENKIEGEKKVRIKYQKQQDALKEKLLSFLKQELERIKNDNVTSWIIQLFTFQYRTQLKINALEKIIDDLSNQSKLIQVDQQIDFILAEQKITQRRRLGFFKSTVEKRLRCFKMEICAHNEVGPLSAYSS